MKIKFFALVMVLSITGLMAQNGPKNWFNLDYGMDGINGMSTEKAYKELLAGKTSKTVVVAVIDGGVDPHHEDLKDVMWKNPGEIAGNGIDDDKNGYVDDVFGWNFIGGKDGQQVGPDQLEITRLYVKYHNMYKNADLAKLSGKAKKEYSYYLELKEKVEDKQASSKKNLANMLETRDNLLNALKSVETQLDGKAVTSENLKAIEHNGDQDLVLGINVLSRSMEGGDKVSIDEVRETIKEQIQGGIDYYKSQAEYHYNPDFNPRGLVGDNYNDITEKYYGNNDVKGPDAFHGTHVAGIVAASRDNGKGIKGVANNVRIMAVRAVPDGDERDKDVANSIRYAVDNGAQIINMSFGKSYAWNKDVVDKAVKYAKKKGVLLIHAAGNDASNNDKNDNFPNDNYRKKGFLGLGAKKCDLWMEIGALSFKGEEDALATFSNYGTGEVDVFAPGVAIYSTAPDGEYKDASGTSMACPATAGAAALVLSYYPSLSAKQLKDILLKSAVKQNYSVKLPGSDELVPFSSVAATGATINVYEALKLAAKTTGKRKAKNAF